MAIFQNFGRQGQQQSGIQQQLSNLQTQGPQIAEFLNQLNTMAPSGPQAQAAPMALGLAQQLQQGISPQERAQASQGIGRQLNSALGNIAGGGATGASFQTQAGTQALPGFANALAGLQAQDEQVRRQGQESVFNQLAGTLTQPDPQQQAFGQLLAQSQGQRRRGLSLLPPGGTSSRSNLSSLLR